MWASRRLVKEACSFWPTPDNCRKSHSGYSENRKEFAKAKNKELVRLGLKKTRVFREDGLVIEWCVFLYICYTVFFKRSEVPVWNYRKNLIRNPQHYLRLKHIQAVFHLMIPILRF